jgi:putative membrane protein
MDRRTALLALASAVALAPQSLSATTPHRVTLSPRGYRMAALMGGDFAILTSELALQRSRNPHVRRFAELEIHEQVSVAASLGAQPGTAGLRPDQAALFDQLNATRPSPRFDQLYVRGQIIGHRELLGLNSAYRRASAGDPTGLAVANLAVPSIETHLTILGRLRA